MPAIKKPNQHFDVTTYTGNGGTQSIVNAGGFQPDLTWIKTRNVSGYHVVNDSVRGAGKILASNDTGSEATNAAFDAFNSNGFTVVDNANWYTNRSGQTYVAWQWKAGGTAVTNNDGTITSQVSANPTAGFSIVTYTGTGSAATIGHGLGVAPSFYIVKNRVDAGTNWYAYHSATGAGNYLVLNATDPSSASVNVWNNTSPTSSVFSVGASASNTSGKNYVAYCWAEIVGFSKFGSYTGNGSSDGPFIYFGFRPKYVLIKCSSAGSLSWVIFDTSRQSFNSGNAPGLWPNESSSELNYTTFDILSNGIKIRETSPTINGNGNTYIYAAFAENPFKYATAR